MSGGAAHQLVELQPMTASPDETIDIDGYIEEANGADSVHDDMYATAANTDAALAKRLQQEEDDAAFAARLQRQERRAGGAGGGGGGGGGYPGSRSGAAAGRGTSTRISGYPGSQLARRPPPAAQLPCRACTALLEVPAGAASFRCGVCDTVSHRDAQAALLQQQWAATHSAGALAANTLVVECPCCKSSVHVPAGANAFRCGGCRAVVDMGAALQGGMAAYAPYGRRRGSGDGLLWGLTAGMFVDAILYAVLTAQVKESPRHAGKSCYEVVTGKKPDVYLGEGSLAVTYPVIK